MPVVGWPVSQVDLPAGCLIVSVRRSCKLHIAHGDTVLQAGDRVTLFAVEDCLLKTRQALTGEPPEGSIDVMG